MIRTRRVLSALAAGGALLVGGALYAATTRSFRQTTAKDFEDGEATAVTILPTGEVVPGWKATRLPLEAAFVWCSALSPDGRTAYFGSGDEGRVYAVSVQAEGKEAAARKVADVDAAWVTSLAVRPDGTVLVGTTPGGRVFIADPKGGAARPFAKIDAEHVWALVHDTKSGVTYAAGGGDGKLFAIDAKGGVKRLWDSGDKQITSLQAAADGTLLAGTSDQGILYRVHANGRAEALHDFDADEIRAITRSSRGTFLAVNDFDKDSSEVAPAAAAAKGTRVSAGGPAPASLGGARPSQLKSRSAVYRLDADGSVEQVFALADGYLTALLPLSNGDVLAASGTRGKVYRLFEDRSFALVVDVPERQALTLAPSADGVLVGTGDIGGVYRVRPGLGTESVYLSKVFDADVFARWGALRWTGTSDLVFTTRSGNTAKPDKSWGDFVKLSGASIRAGEGEGKVASPPARYVQYRVQLPAKTSALRDVTLYHLPQNLRPRVTDVSLAPEPPGPSTHSSVLKLRFRVDNPDNDELLYRTWARLETDRVWRALGGPLPLTKPELDWNTDSFPDGRYVVRVDVSDEPSTSSDRALSSSFESSPLLVDNGKPEIVGLAAKGLVVTGRAQDAVSPLKEIEYAVDGGEFHPAAPDDAILDQRAEPFTIRLPAALAKGLHVITARALDAADNVGSARVQVEVK